MFPELGGQKFPTRIPTWEGAGRFVRAASGRTASSLNWQAPLYAWELSYDGVCADDSHPGLTARSMQMIEDLFHRCGGKYGSTFLYRDPDDCVVSGQNIGVGDGTTTTFTFQRTLVEFTAPVCWVTAVDAIYINGGAPVPATGWTLSEPNKLVFVTAPAASAVITADFHYAFECRWDVDEIEFHGFASRLSDVQSLRFVSERPA